MVFSAIARFAQRFRIIVVIFWLAAAVALYLGAPSFSNVAVTDESQFLPQDTQSAAEEFYDRTAACTFTSFVAYDAALAALREGAPRHILIARAPLDANPGHPAAVRSGDRLGRQALAEVLRRPAEGTG